MVRHFITGLNEMKVGAAKKLGKRAFQRKRKTKIKDPEAEAHSVFTQQQKASILTTPG